MLHPVTNDEIIFTKQQMGCVNYAGDKRRDLVIRSAAGGGKSLVLIQRAKNYLEEAKRMDRERAVVIFTYNHVLARWLYEWMELTPEDSPYIHIGTLHEYLNSVYGKLSGTKLGNQAYDQVKARALRETLEQYAAAMNSDKYQQWGTKFWEAEFTWMRSMNIFDRSDRDRYMNMEREGRGHEHHMMSADRIAAFSMFCVYQDKLREKRCYDASSRGDERILYLTHNENLIPDSLKFDHVLIDEAQDQSLAQMIALRSIARMDVTVCMDANQRIYEGRWRFSQAGLVPTSKRLSIPFRCTGQIDALAESLKSHNRSEVADEDQVEHTAPIAVGDKPEIIRCKDTDEERRYVVALIKKWMRDDPDHNIGIMCYTNDAVAKVGNWLTAANIQYDHVKYDENSHFSIKSPGVKLCTIHTSKGLEFMRVILPQFYQGMLPQRWAVDDEEQLIKQRNVAYVGMTRAMHQLTIVYSGSKSQFVGEMDPAVYTARTFDEAVKVESQRSTSKYVKRQIPAGEQSAEQPQNDTHQESRRARWTFS